MPNDLLLLLDAPPAGGGLTSVMFPMIAMAAIFYFIMYRPQKREQEEHQKLLASLQRGDRVVTTTGLHGRVEEVKGTTLLLEIAPNTVVTVERDSVRRRPEDPPAKVEPAAGAKT